MFSPCERILSAGFVVGMLVASGSLLADEKKEVALKVGDAGPAFSLTDDAGKTWNSADHYGKKLVVVYFYPGDFTPGCTAQANAFRDAMNTLTDKGVEVVGISGDTVATHEQFKTVQKLNFALLADPEGIAAKKFGVPFGKGAKVKGKDTGGKPLEIERPGTAARWTFIVGKDGKIAYINNKVIPAQDAKNVLEFAGKAEAK